jgi:lipopolysaccharide export system permease protein
MVMLIAFVDIARNVGTRADVGFAELLYLTILQAPATILVLTPFIFLFGTLGAFVGLNRRSELIAMRAAGVSAWRFIMPAATAAFVMGLLTITLLNPLTSAMTAQFEVSRDAMMENYLKTAPKGTWLRQGDDKTQIVIRARARDQVDGSVRLRGVSLFVYTLNTKGVMEFSRRIEANEARLEPGFWRLIGVREATPGAGRSAPTACRSPPTSTTAPPRSGSTTPQAVALWRCRRPSSAPRRPASRPSAVPPAFAAGSGHAVAFRRHVGAGGRLFAAFDASGRSGGARRRGRRAGLWFLLLSTSLCSALGKADVLHPAIAAWTPPIVALLAGFTLLCYTEDG